MTDAGITICGAGAVGLVVGARLAAAGLPVWVVTRRAEQARAIEAGGLEVEDPATDARRGGPARAVTDPHRLPAAFRRGPVLFCVRGSQLEAAAGALAEAAPGAAVAGLQNDVGADALLARRFASVTGVVVRQTCTRSGERSARATGAGRLVVGSHPSGCGPDARALAAALEKAGYDVGTTTALTSDRWLKLCINLMSAPNALIRRSDHTTRAFVELKARLLEEARDTLAAAGIEARSGDGRDRSLDEEIAWQREALARGASARALPLYNQVWSALRHGGPLEADGYHRRILELARAHGVAAPQNARVLERLLRCQREGTGPESLAARELLAP